MEEERKVERKRKRFAARLLYSKSVMCTETPGQNIVLCNAGRATGFKKDDVINIINEFSLEIQLPKFVAEKGESHSFIVFQSTKDAVSFFDACHGKAKADKDGTTLYLNFVNTESVPIADVICPYEDPKGLTLLNNFITEEEESLFLKLFDWTEDASNLKNRQVKHYGYEFRYGTNDVDLDNPLVEVIPQECDMLWKRLEEHGFTIDPPDQLTVNKYCPGQGIPSHVDRHSPFGGTILSLSLGSSVVMEWRHHSGMKVPIELPMRSMLVMQNEARYDWQHGIQASATDPVVERRHDQRVLTGETRPRQTRISLTFRWTRRGRCECNYPTLCDTGGGGGGGGQNAEMDDNVASHLEDLHVHQVYEQIARHFSSTRHTPWPRVVQFVRDVTPGSVMLDLGAGNGKNILGNNDILQIACERSSGLLAECAAHTRALPAAVCVRMDVRRAALRDACADRVICIAVVHHMSTEARRLQAISTIHRLLRLSGKALITVWAKDQSCSNYLSKTKVASENEQVNVNGVNLHIHENRTQFQHKDLLVPWKLKVKSDKSKSGKQREKGKKSTDKAKNGFTESDNQLSESDSKLAISEKSKLAISESKLTESESKPTVSTLLRYYHVFEEGELDKLCRKVGFQVESSFYEEGNWCVICQKV